MKYKKIALLSLAVFVLSGCVTGQTPQSALPPQEMARNEARALCYRPINTDGKGAVILSAFNQALEASNEALRECINENYVRLLPVYMQAHHDAEANRLRAQANQMQACQNARGAFSQGFYCGIR